MRGLSQQPEKKKAEQKGVSSRYILVGLRKKKAKRVREPQSDVGKVSRFPTEQRNGSVSDGSGRKM